MRSSLIDKFVLARRGAPRRGAHLGTCPPLAAEAPS